MQNESHSRSVKVTLAVIVLFLLAYFGWVWIVRLRQASNIAMVTDKVHILTVKLKEYVEDRGDFPRNLESMVSEMGLDPKILRPIAGETIEYTRPERTGKGSTEVIVVTLGAKKIIVDKDFDRKP